MRKFFIFYLSLTLFVYLLGAGTGASFFVAVVGSILNLTVVDIFLTLVNSFLKDFFDAVAGRWLLLYYFWDFLILGFISVYFRSGAVSGFLFFYASLCGGFVATSAAHF